MFGAILKATNSSFKKGMTFCRSIYVKKVMKLLAFIFEQPSFMLIWVFSGTRRLSFGLGLQLNPYFAFLNSGGSVDSARCIAYLSIHR